MSPFKFFLLKRKNSKKSPPLLYKERKKKAQLRRNFLWSFLIFFSLGYCITQYFFFPLEIKEDSLLPTIARGEVVWVNKLAYGLKKPFMYDSVGNRWQSASLPKRGALVALINPQRPTSSPLRKLFDFPLFLLSLGFYKHDPKQLVVRRVVGLPGERIAIKNKALYINGKLFAPQWPIQFEDTRVLPAALGKRDQLEEKFIPINYFFLLSDNWDLDNDSRTLDLIPFHLIEGKVLGF